MFFVGRDRRQTKSVVGIFDKKQTEKHEEKNIWLLFFPFGCCLGGDHQRVGNCFVGANVLFSSTAFHSPRSFSFDLSLIRNEKTKTKKEKKTQQKN